MNSLHDIILRNAVMNVEDALVSGAGLVSGLLAAGMSMSSIIKSLTIAAGVSAFSMACGSYISEDTQDKPNPKVAAITAFISYVVASFIVLIPLLVTSGRTSAIYVFCVPVITLFGVGYAAAHIQNTPEVAIRKGVTAAVLGAAAIAAGTLIGKT